MLRVIIQKSNGHELARIDIENVTRTRTEHGDYSVQFAVDTGDGNLAMYQRRVENFPRKRYNVLGLLRLALSALDEKELTLDTDPDAPGSPDMERRLDRPR